MKHYIKSLLALAAVFAFSAMPALAQVNTSPILKYYSANGNLSSPSGVTIIQQGTVTSNSSGNVTNASAVATLTPGALQVAYVTGFRCDPGGATAAALANVSLAGVAGGPLTYTAGAPAGVTLTGTPVERFFSPPLPASAINTPITVTMGALGSGNVRASCSMTGILW